MIMDYWGGLFIGLIPMKSVFIKGESNAKREAWIRVMPPQIKAAGNHQKLEEKQNRFSEYLL